MFNLSPDLLIARLIVLLICLPVHEFAHAWSADRFGDDTPRANGRLTLNPLAHLDIMGSLLLMVAGFGWAKPVPINPYALGRRSPLAVMWVSLAGPLSNFFLAILGAIPARIMLADPAVLLALIDPNQNPLSPTVFAFDLIIAFIQINLLLMLFNLIPIVPLDGSKIVPAIMPESWLPAFERISVYGPVILLVVIFLLPRFNIDILGWIITPPMQKLLTLLIGA